MKNNRVELWSSGGGVQSSAIAALIVLGKLPKPDLAAIVDTGRELSTTWKYLDEWVIPALSDVGVTLQRIPKDRYATVDLYSKKSQDILIPAFTTMGQSIGKLPTYCSNEWKLRPLQRWANEQRPKSQFNLWMGFTLDEGDRMQMRDGKWKDKYPLIKLGLHRHDCYKIIERVGWPTPPRSSCYMCPNKHKSEWRWQKENAPDDFQQAIDFEKEIQTIDPDLWLAEEGRPLDECSFNNQEDLFVGGGGCGSGMCFV